MRSMTFTGATSSICGPRSGPQQNRLNASDTPSSRRTAVNQYSNVGKFTDSRRFSQLQILTTWHPPAQFRVRVAIGTQLSSAGAAQGGSSAEQTHSMNTSRIMAVKAACTLGTGDIGST